jgi:hypothetical protein
MLLLAHLACLHLKVACMQNAACSCQEQCYVRLSCSCLWAYASAKCRERHMLHLAARHALVLGHVRVFSSSQQPCVLLRAFKGFGMAGGVVMHDVNAALVREVGQADGAGAAAAGAAGGGQQVAAH